MSTENSVRYEQLGRFIATHRAKVGLKQAEFADQVGSAQQTVSRWESGVARPRQRDLANIAAVLNVSADELHEAADYREKGEVVATFDKPFPLHALTPESFENFCADLLLRMHGRKAAVERAGKTGHAQYGIDIEVRFDGNTDVYQCKRVERFGPAKVVAAMSAGAAVPARSKVLMLSCVASPDARAKVKGTDWEIWDQDDLSRKARTLPEQDKVELVDQYFRGLRYPLLGIEEFSSWQSPQTFFAPFVGMKVFGHSWTLVGRDAERDALLTALLDPEKECILLVGPGGSGKSRLLWDVLQELKQRMTAVHIRMLTPQVPLNPRSLEGLGSHQTLLVVDDAHDREDLGLLLRHVAASNGTSRLLLSLRPYGLDSARRQAASLSMAGGHVAEVNVGPLTKESAEQLAHEVLCKGGGDPSAAATIAKHTFESALFTVLAAHVAARDGLHPHFIGNTEDFQRKVYLEFEHVITNQIAAGTDGERLRDVLSLIALVQPVAKDDESLLQLIEKTAKVTRLQAARLFNLLVNAGILFQRGRTFRLAPDLLADSIIERSCFTPEGRSHGYAEAVFDAAPSGYLKNLILNLGRLDWRKNLGDTSASGLLTGIWTKLQWQSNYSNPHIEAALSVAYYQPRQAIDFATRLIRDGHGADRNVAEILKYAAYNMAHAVDALTLLWRIGRNDASPQNQNPSHAVRILKELATPGPNKPVEYVRLVVDFFLKLLKRPKEFHGACNPLDVLEGALALESSVHNATSRQVTISRFRVNLDAVAEIRRDIRDAILGLIPSPDQVVAFKAAAALSECLRGAIGGFTDDAQKSAHREFVAATVHEVRMLVEAKTLPATILVRLVQAVAGRAWWHEGGLRIDAQAICDQLDRDLETQTIRAMMDAWGTNIRDFELRTGKEIVEDNERRLLELCKSVLAEYPAAEDLEGFLVSCLEQVKVVKGASDNSSFRVTRMLVDGSFDLARRIMTLHREGAPHVLMQFAGQALATLLRHPEDPADRWLQDLLARPTKVNLELLAEGLTLVDAAQLGRADLRRAIDYVVSSKEPSVLWRGAHLMIQIARVDPAFALQLICKVDLNAAGASADDYLMLLGSSGLIPTEILGDAEVHALLTNLSKLPDLSGYWIVEFLKNAVKRSPEAVAAFVKTRLLKASSDRTWTFHALSHVARETDSLNMGGNEQGLAALIELFTWAIEHIEDERFAEHLERASSVLCGAYDDDLLEALVGWAHFGTEAHARVLSAVIAGGPRTMVTAKSSLVIRILEEVEPISEEAVQDVRDGFWRSSSGGVRWSSPGEATEEDLEMVRVASDVLARLTPLDAAYKLYEALKRDAERNIAFARREKEEFED